MAALLSASLAAAASLAPSALALAAAARQRLGVSARLALPLRLGTCRSLLLRRHYCELANENESEGAVLPRKMTKTMTASQGTASVSGGISHGWNCKGTILPRYGFFANTLTEKDK